MFSAPGDLIVYSVEKDMIGLGRFYHLRQAGAWALTARLFLGIDDLSSICNVGGSVRSGS